MASLALLPFRPLFSPNTFLNSSARTSNRNNSIPPRVHLRPIYCIRAINGQVESASVSTQDEQLQKQRRVTKATNPLMHAIPCSSVISWLSFVETARSSEITKLNMMYQTSEFFELGIQLSYVVTLLALLGAGTFFVIRQVLVRRELDLSAKDLQEQVRSGDASGTEYFELGAVMLRRKFYPAAIKYLKEAISKWDRDDQDLAQVYNALGVSYARDNNLEKGIKNLEMAVKLQPGYVTAWNNLGDAYEKKKDMKAALRAFEEALLFDPNNKVARPRAEMLRDKVRMYRGVEVRSKER